MFKRYLIFVAIVLIFSCAGSCKNLINNSPDVNNHSPNPLAGPSTVLIERESIYEQTVQLFCTENIDSICLFDIDGDPVSVVVDPLTPLPSYMTLDDSTGLLSIINATGDNCVINFWTKDEYDSATEDSLLSVSFSLIVNEAPYPIIGPGSLNVSLPPGDSSINLIVDTQGGLNDPDGEEVSFHYSIAYQDAGTADDVIIDLSNIGGVGVLTVTHPGSVLSGEYVSLNLWTMDPHGRPSTVFTPFALFYASE